jgi:hypothetical protein
MNVKSDRISDSEMTTSAQGQLHAYVQPTDSPRLSWYRSGGLLNERLAHRVAFPETLHVVGLRTCSGNGLFVADTDGIIARGRDISVGGISFRHDDLLPHRFVAVSFRSPFGTQILVAKLLWCRFAGEGHYMSGGQLVVEAQFHSELDIDWDAIQAGL